MSPSKRKVPRRPEPDAAPALRVVPVYILPHECHADRGYVRGPDGRPEPVAFDVITFNPSGSAEVDQAGRAARGIPEPSEG